MIEWMQYVLHAFPRAVILRCERPFISAFTRVFNALWRASLEGWRL